MIKRQYKPGAESSASPISAQHRRSTQGALSLKRLPSAGRRKSAAELGHQLAEYAKSQGWLLGRRTTLSKLTVQPASWQQVPVLVTDIKDPGFKAWCGRNGLWAVTSDLKTFNEALALGFNQAKGLVAELPESPAPVSAPSFADGCQRVFPPEFPKYNPLGLEATGTREMLWNYACLVGWRQADTSAQGPHEVPGLGTMTDEDDGVVTLRFKDEAAAQAFIHAYTPTVDYRDMPAESAMPDEPATGGDPLAGVICWLETDEGGLCQAERPAEKILNTDDAFVRLSTVKRLLGSAQRQHVEAERVRGKLDAVWGDIEKLIAAHTGAPCVGEPLDVLAGLLASAFNANAKAVELDQTLSSRGGVA